MWNSPCFLTWLSRIASQQSLFHRQRFGTRLADNWLAKTVLSESTIWGIQNQGARHSWNSRTSNSDSLEKGGNTECPSVAFPIAIFGRWGNTPYCQSNRFLDQAQYSSGLLFGQRRSGRKRVPTVAMYHSCHPWQCTSNLPKEGGSQKYVTLSRFCRWIGFYG